MSKLLIIILVLFGTAQGWAQNKDVRSSSGELVQVWRQQGNQTDVRSGDNELLYTRNRQGNTVTIRSASGEEEGSEYYDDRD